MKQPSIFEALLIYHILTKDEDKTEWILKTESRSPLYEYYQCKKCGWTQELPSHYCPQCGREAMRGEK